MVHAMMHSRAPSYALQLQSCKLLVRLHSIMHMVCVLRNVCPVSGLCPRIWALSWKTYWGATLFGKPVFDVLYLTLSMHVNACIMLLILKPDVIFYFGFRPSCARMLHTWGRRARTVLLLARYPWLEPQSIPQGLSNGNMIQ